jgi:hypothetical protein
VLLLREPRADVIRAATALTDRSEILSLTRNTAKAMLETVPHGYADRGRLLHADAAHAACNPLGWACLAYDSCTATQMSAKLGVRTPHTAASSLCYHQEHMRLPHAAHFTTCQFLGSVVWTHVEWNDDDGLASKGVLQVDGSVHACWKVWACQAPYLWSPVRI